MFSLLIAYVIHKPGRTLSGFLRIFWELYVSKVKLASLHGNFINWVANPEITYKLLLFQILLTDTLKEKKNAYFDRNLLHFNGTGMARKQPLESFFEKWMFWVVTCLGLNAFLPIWVLFALDFVVILLAVVTATRSFRGKHQYLYFIKKKKSTWNKHDNSVPLKFFN